MQHGHSELARQKATLKKTPTGLWSVAIDLSGGSLVFFPKKLFWNLLKNFTLPHSFINTCYATFSLIVARFAVLQNID